MKTPAIRLLIVLCIGVTIGYSEGSGAMAEECSRETPRDDLSFGMPSKCLPNFTRFSDGIHCGGEPSGALAFAELAARGIKTVVSVDGADPDVETARKHGLRYVHIPIGYDGIDQHARLSLARVAREADRPVYFHCHHGQHRGPAAAAIASLASGESDHASAVKLLERAGTDPNYSGLWRAVENYRLPSSETKLPELVEVAERRTIAATMAQIDREFQQLRKTDDDTRREHALLLKELFRESQRQLPRTSPPAFKRWLADSERVAESVEHALAVEDHPRASAQIRRLKELCVRCHEKFRN